MTFTIAEYFDKESTDWNDTIRFYLEEITELEQRLQELIRRDSIPHVAEKTENLLNQLEAQQQQFFGLHHEIHQQEKKLVHNGVLTDNTKITADVAAVQASLRKKMYAAEKGFPEVKYGCYEFLSGVLTR